jgi:hypothetical protein
VAYEWASEIEALSVAYVRGLSLNQVGDLLHFGWETERRITFAGAEAQQDYSAGRYAVQVEPVESQRGSWLVLIEPNGYLTSLPDALEALSDLDVALSVYWNVNAQMQFVMYAEGILVRSFDPLVPDLDPQGKPLVEEEGLRFGLEGEPRAVTLTLAEHLTGVAIGRDWLLDVPRQTWTCAGFSAE